jgi:hypothetical protein
MLQAAQADAEAPGPVAELTARNAQICDGDL